MTKAPASHTEAHFHDEEAARAHLEATRWPNGPECPHCGGVERISRIEANPAKKVRAGLLFCGDCRQQFSVTVGTVFEDSKLPIHKWVYAIHLICASKKGISSKQLERVLGVTYKTAWFMSHRIREAMGKAYSTPMGGKGKIVEVDETYYGNLPGKEIRPGSKKHKNKIMALVERGGDVRAMHVAEVDGRNVKDILQAQVADQTHVMTDEARIYASIPYKHSTVNHSIYEYARGNVTTNTVEGFFSILKRGLTGVYQHVSEQHLQRYVSEFEFRYNNREAQGIDDQQRAAILMKGIQGKRLTYRRTHEASA
ncbi:MAG: IS1595 family transposase [Betaproteobacteria bacterium]